MRRNCQAARGHGNKEEEEHRVQLTHYVGFYVLFSTTKIWEEEPQFSNDSIFACSCILLFTIIYGKSAADGGYKIFTATLGTPLSKLQDGSAHDEASETGDGDARRYVGTTTPMTMIWL